MRFKTLTGAERKVIGINKYLINWDAKSKSKFQKSVKDFLQPYWNRHVVFEEFPVAGTRMSLDFYNSTQKIAVEVDGNQHYRYNQFFHSNSRQKFLHQLHRDEKKEYFCEINKIKLIRVLESDVLDSKKYPKSLIKLLK